MSDTIFHKIIRREIPAQIVLENEELIAFKDINPAAPVHILIVPKKTIPTTNDLQSEDALLAGKLLLAAKEIARQEGIAAGGYRLVFNCGENGQQTVNQLHLHLIGGRAFEWPPG